MICVCFGTGGGRCQSENEPSGTRAGVLVQDDDWHLCADQVKLGVSTSVCD